MEVFNVFRGIALVVAWGIPALLVLGVLVFIILAPAFTFGGMATKLYEKVFARQGKTVRQETVPTIGEMLRTTKLPPEEEPKAKTVEAKE